MSEMQRKPGELRDASAKFFKLFGLDRAEVSPDSPRAAYLDARACLNRYVSTYNRILNGVGSLLSGKHLAHLDNLFQTLTPPSQGFGDDVNLFFDSFEDEEQSDLIPEDEIADERVDASGLKDGSYNVAVENFLSLYELFDFWLPADVKDIYLTNYDFSERLEASLKELIDFVDNSPNTDLSECVKCIIDRELENLASLGLPMPGGAYSCISTRSQSEESKHPFTLG